MSAKENILLATVSEKGGTGKSMTACTLLDHLRSSGFKVAAYDSDGSMGALREMHGQRNESGRLLEKQDPLAGVASYNIRDESRTMLVESMRSQYSHMLHDGAGGGLNDLKRILSDREGLVNLFRAFARLGVHVVYIHPLTPDKSSVRSVKEYLDNTDGLGELAHLVSHVAVLNRHNGTEDADFPFWFGGQEPDGTSYGGHTRQRLLAGGGEEMELPALNPGTAARVKALGVPFSQAVHDARLRLIDQMRVHQFLEDFAEGLTPSIKTMMGLS